MKIKKCNICGGQVEFIDNKLIYGKTFGSGKAYRCKKCGAFVGTHMNNPTEPLGVLADEEMRDLRKQCHELFDKRWSNNKERLIRYKWLAYKLDIPLSRCHFAMFDKSMLNKALVILKEESCS